MSPPRKTCVSAQKALNGVFMTDADNREELHPHSPDAAVRAELDGGFSKGWGLHFQPNEAYWLDCHCHMGTDTTHPQIYRMLEEWFAELDAYRLGRVVVIATKPEAFQACRDVASQDPRFRWFVAMPYDQPDVDLLQRALDCGALGAKLHNSPLMSGKGKPDIWLTDAWARVFRLVEQAGRAVLWHITQRLSVSPYHGGSENAYWRDGWKVNVTVTNEQLLQVALQVMRQHPRIPFIGAHQLHLGLERLTALLQEHKNLFIDTSCGFVVRWADVLYDHDRDILRQFFLKHPDRILFGTDASLFAGGTDAWRVQAFLAHARFINQLRLPDEVLQKVAHANAERIFKMDAIVPPCRGNSRP